MTIGESVYVAVFLLAVVFVVLFGLYLCIKLFTLMMDRAQKRVD